ncbi:MAG: aminotransferase class V-fold PLP-dependent enzyme [Alphaproteobacteria bacterium]|nr:aminotransferase class V-fold PLP-dependent enzyme [Alphaproteobacteria bacterium]
MHGVFGSSLAIEAVRKGLAGRDLEIETPMGRKPMLYADYTASGRALAQVDAQIAQLEALYANPHTEDSLTGRQSGRWMREAVRTIKACVNASDEDVLIATGSGATAAIHKLQEILGLALAPATAERLGAPRLDQAPVIFVGPYEHHSNELSWRESLAEVVCIPLNETGGIDLDYLAARLKDPAFEGREKIGAFSAASNVTGLKTDVPALARLLHAHGAILCLDCAASAPYAPIDMHPENDPDAAIDAVYFSPHKFIGGPGACGVLIFNPDLYRTHLPPTQSAGGTVKYVWKDGHDFIEDIEARERAGTPGVPQIVRAALAMKLQAEIGFDLIEEREQAALRGAFSQWLAHPKIEVLGPIDPESRLGIVSFNILGRDGERLHPRLLTVLLNDHFGIQSRAGCSCAGPYGHDLLGIDDDATQSIRRSVLSGQAGDRPGWCRVSLHWVMSEEEVQRLIRAVLHLADYAETLMQDYDYEPCTGMWSHKDAPAPAPAFPDQLLLS